MPEKNTKRTRDERIRKDGPIDLNDGDLDRVQAGTSIEMRSDSPEPTHGPNLRKIKNFAKRHL